MKLLKKLMCGFLSVALILSCCTNIVFAEDSGIPSEKKTIYNFSCKEEEMNLENTALITETPVSYYQGYTDDFFVSTNTFPGFEHGTLFIRDKGAANGGTYTKSAYGNNGELYDGLEGRDYWMSFDITTGATVYMVDREGQMWPSKPDDWYLAGDIGGKSVFAKHFNAGEKVNVPCYGWNEEWDKADERIFKDPSYFVVAWDNDVGLKSFTYTLDSGTPVTVDGYSEIDKGGVYNVNLEYRTDGYNIVTKLTAMDAEAKVEVSGEESIKLEYGYPQSVEYTITSEAGDEVGVYTVNYTMLDKRDAGIEVNSALSEFNAKENLTNIYMPENYAGDTAACEVPIASYDENNYYTCAEYQITYTQGSSEKTVYADYADIYNYIGKYTNASAVVSAWKYTDENVYTINKGVDFYTDGYSFGVTGSAFDRASHILTSSQFAPGNVSADSFEAADDTVAQQYADEFKSWLRNDSNYMYTMTPNYDCVVYAAFSQKNSKNHTGFIADGWTFNDYSGVSVPDEAVLEEFKDYSSPKWWMTDSAYNYNGNPYLLIKNKYTTEAATNSRNYFYIWSKSVKAGETVYIPVGGSAFSSARDVEAPKVLINWRSGEMSDDVSGAVMCGERRILIDDSLKSRTLPTMVAEVGDVLSYEGNNGATAEFSQDEITILPCVVEAVITSEAGSKVKYMLSFKEQPEITSVNVSPIRGKFVENTGKNKIELSPYLAGEIYQEKRSRQVFEEDENGILQPVYDENGDYLFESSVRPVGRAFYRDRAQHKYAHVGEGFKNMQYFWIPSNDATTRRKTVYTNENEAYAADNNGEEKLWEFENEDGTVEKLNYTEMSSRYEDYVLGNNEYFNFTADGSGVVYAVLEYDSPNFNVVNGWKKFTVDVPLPEGHASWSSVDADVTNPLYPYQLGKIQYDGHATEYHIFDTVYYKAFEADEVVSIPTTGVADSDVMAVMIGWEDFISDDAGGMLYYGNNRMRLRNDKEKYTVYVYDNKNMDISFTPAYEYARAELSDTDVKLSELPKTVTLDTTNAFGVSRTFEIEFVVGSLDENKVFNLDTASEYTVYESEDGGAYNADKGFIKFSEGVYMLEENLELGVSSYYSDRLTHKFTSENTDSIFDGATYIRRPKKSGDYGNWGFSYASSFYADSRYNGKDGNGSWISFGISSDADIYVGVPGDGVWPNKPDDWQEADVKLAGCTKVYKKSYSIGDNVEIPSMGWYSEWDVERTSWDLPVYVVVWN